MPKWLQFVLHVAVIAGGAYLSYATGTPLPLVVTSGINALLPGVGNAPKGGN